GDVAARVSREMIEAVQKIQAALIEGGAQDLGIGPNEIGGREGVQPLPRREGGELGVSGLDARRMQQAMVEPLLDQQEIAGVNAERRNAPNGVGEAMIIGPR